MAQPLIIPVFPLTNVVLFPGVRMPFRIFEPRYREMLSEVLDGAGLIGMPMPLPGYDLSESATPPLTQVFGVGQVETYETHDDGTSHILLVGQHRARTLNEVSSTPFRRVEAELLEDVEPTEAESRSLRDALRERVERLVELGLNPEAKTALDEILDDDRDVGFIVNLLATVVVTNSQVRQNLLEVNEIPARGRHLLTILDTQSQMWSPDYTAPGETDREDDS